MKITLDVKTLVIGFLAGALFSLVLGVTNAGDSEFGFAIPSGGRAVIKNDRSEGFVLDAATGRAVPIRYADGEDHDLYSD
jgi:microcystin-dependent protein